LNRKGEFSVKSGEVIDLPVQVQIDPVKLERTGNDIRFHLESVDNPELTVSETGRFIGPVMR